MAPTNSRAFSLIEMIGVVTVLILLALALTPILIKQFDRLAAEKEERQLKSFAEAFRLSVLNSKVITNANGWDAVIAANLGVNVTQVRTNDRRFARAFLIDPTLRIGRGLADDAPGINNSLPYAQAILRSTPGAPSPLNKQAPGSRIVDGFWNVLAPVNPRVMILSSMSGILPVSSGPASDADAFNSVWNCPDGGIPANSAWSGWTRGDDLKIQRVNLGDLLIEVVLNNQNPVKDTGTYQGETPYDVDQVASARVPRTNSVALYLLDSTLLTLYGTNGVRQYSEILHESKSFVYDGGSWKGGGYVGPTIHHPDPLDMQLVADAFLPPPFNPAAGCNATGDCNTNVYNAMIRFMTLYVTWAGENFGGTPTLDCLTGNGSCPDPGAQPDLHAKAYDLITKP